MDDVIERLSLHERALGSLVPDSPSVGVVGQTKRSDGLERTESKGSSEDGKACSRGEETDADTELTRSWRPAGHEPTVKQTTAENFRNWERKMRKRELQRQSPQPRDLQREYRFWELKLRKGELDPLLEKSRQTWLLDKVAEIPETLMVGTARTFWEVKTTEGNEKRCMSMPVRERPLSLSPSVRPSLREGFEKCARSSEDIYILQSVFSAYFENVDEEMLLKNNDGRTVMLQDLKKKWSIEDVLGLCDQLGAKDVDYVFLPLGVWETRKKKDCETTKPKRNDARNKSFCFVHFSDVAACEAFVDRLSRYEPPNEAPSDDGPPKQMRVSLASTQGIVTNLLRLMDIHNRRWHPRAGALALRLGDSLVLISVAGLRTFLQDLLKDSPKEAPACLQKHCTLSFFFGPSTFLPSGSQMSSAAA